MISLALRPPLSVRWFPHFPFASNQPIQSKWNTKNMWLWLKELLRCTLWARVEGARTRFNRPTHNRINCCTRLRRPCVIFGKEISNTQYLAGNMCAITINRVKEIANARKSEKSSRTAVIVRSINAEGNHSACALTWSTRTHRASFSPSFYPRLRALRMPTIIICIDFSLRASLE